MFPNTEGVWVIDLSVTQILQEQVEENRRGVINGVQDSINNWYVDLTMSTKIFHTIPKILFNWRALYTDKAVVCKDFSFFVNYTSSLDTLKSLLVIFMPNVEQFGILIILSFTSVTCGAISYTTYVLTKKKREAKHETELEEQPEQQTFTYPENSDFSTPVVHTKYS